MLAEKQVLVLDLTNSTITSEADLQTVFHSLNKFVFHGKERSLTWQKAILHRRRHPLIIYVMQLGSGEDPELQNTLKNASYQGGRAAN